MIQSRPGPAHTLYERTLQQWHQLADWFAANSLDLAFAALAALVIALILLGLRKFGYKLIRDRDATISWRTIFGRVLAKTSLFFIVMAAIKLVSVEADAPHFLQRLIDIFFVIATAFQAAVWGRELTLGFIEHRVGASEESSTLSSAIGIVRLLVTVTLFAIAIILILDNLGVNVTGLVAGLGIGGIAIGLAAQGIFRDLFAALSIIFDRPFRKGDAIKFDQVNGTVEEIGLKSTRIRAASGELVVVSNARLLEKDLSNFARVARRRVTLPFAIAYGTAPDRSARVPDIARAVVERHKPATFVRCGFTGFGVEGLDHELQFEVKSRNYDELFAVRAAVGVELLQAFRDAGIAFPKSPEAGPEGSEDDRTAGGWGGGAAGDPDL